MIIEELKRNNNYCFYCDISKSQIIEEIAGIDFFDMWGVAVVSFGDNIVEYNLCIDNTANKYIDSSAIYKVVSNEIDTNNFIPYKINFNNLYWEQELEKIMCKTLIDFFNL